MKPLAKSYPIVAVLGVLLAAGCAIGPGRQAQTSSAQRVLAAYDVPDLLAQAAPAVAQSLDQNLPNDVSSADRQRLRDIVYDVYAPQPLKRDVIESLRASAADTGHKADLAEAADALSSPLATRMIGMQSAAGDEDFSSGFNAFMDQPAPDARKRRLRVVNGLTDAMDIVELQTSFNVTLLESMLRARNAAAARRQRLDDDRVDNMLGSTRQGIHDKLAEKVPQMLLYVYRDVDDAALNEYADLQGRPAVRWTNGALEQAITSTLADAGAKIPDRFKSR